MYRGTTPTITIRIKNSEIDLNSMTQMWVTFKNKSAEVTYDKDDLTIDAESRTIEITLTQEDTLKFQTCGVLQGKVEVQIRMLDDHDLAYASNVGELNLYRILKEGVISNE